MRKFLLSLMAVFLSTALNAQFLNDASVSFSKASGVKSDFSAPAMMKAPAKISLENNQRILGWYTTDEIDEYGLGLNIDATLKLAVYIPSSLTSKFAGGKVVKIRFGLAEATTVNNVFLIPVTDKGIGEPVILQTLSSAAKAGWNEVAIENPVELVTDGSTDYLMGYEYEQKPGEYPLASHPSLGAPSYVYGNLGQGLGWYNLGDSYAFSVQAFVEMENLAAHHVLLSDFYTAGNYAQSGAEMAYALELENFGSEIPEDYAIDIAVDDKVITTVKNPVALSNSVQTFEGTVALPASLETGEHTLSASIASVAGAPQENAYTKATTIFVYQNSVPRQKFLVEQATSHSCTYCPLGENVLKALDGKCDMAWVALHGNMQSTDPYYMETNDYWFSMMGLTGFPYGALNRLPIEGELLTGLGYSADYANTIATYFATILEYYSAPAFATVDIATAYNEDTRALDIKVSGNAVEDFKKIYGEDASLTVYLTEDGLVNKQLNQGKWIAKYEHNHVLRQYVTPYYGETIKWNGEKYENSYSVSLDNDWNAENMHVVAFLTRKIDLKNIDINKMDVNNAEIVKVISENTAIDSVEEARPISAASFYNLAGQKVGADFRGIVTSNGKLILKK